MKKRIKKTCQALTLFFLFMAILTIILVIALNWQLEKNSQQYIYQTINETPQSQTVLALGASVYRNKIMSAMLNDRAQTALEVYKTGKAQKILVSGDNRAKNYNEVDVVKNYLLEQGIPNKDIFLDPAGFDTYDSLWRAKNVFGFDNIIIATQNFHLPRAVFIARQLGIEAYGLAADKHKYKNIEFNIGRELLATVKAYFDVFYNIKPAIAN